MYPSNYLPQTGRGRRTYSFEFKSQVVASCRVPGVSVASVSRTHGINHNVLHRWLRELPDLGTEPLTATASEPAQPSFIELPISASTNSCCPGEDGRVQVNIQRGELSVQLSWPVSAPACARWLVDLLR